MLSPFQRLAGRTEPLRGKNTPPALREILELSTIYNAPLSTGFLELILKFFRYKMLL